MLCGIPTRQGLEPWASSVAMQDEQSDSDWRVPAVSSFRSRRTMKREGALNVSESLVASAAPYGTAAEETPETMTITFSTAARSTMETLMVSTGKTPDEILRDALTIYAYIEQNRDTTRFVVERGGNLREVFFP